MQRMRRKSQKSNSLQRLRSIIRLELKSLKILSISKTSIKRRMKTEGMPKTRFQERLESNSNFQPI
jgi:hypothetical protein